MNINAARTLFNDVWLTRKIPLLPLFLTNKRPASLIPSIPTYSFIASKTAFFIALQESSLSATTSNARYLLRSRNVGNNGFIRAITCFAVWILQGNLIIQHSFVEKEHLFLFVFLSRNRKDAREIYKGFGWKFWVEKLLKKENELEKRCFYSNCFMSSQGYS